MLAAGNIYPGCPRITLVSRLVKLQTYHFGRMLSRRNQHMFDSINCITNRFQAVFRSSQKSRTLLIFNKDGGYEDILIGKQYFDLAFRRLEAGPKERYLKTIGDEMVYLEPTKNFYGHFGFFFEDKWLGKNVVFALIPPLSPTYSRKRLNPETSEPEVV